MREEKTLLKQTKQIAPESTYRRIRHGVVDVGADFDDRLGAGIVREAPRVVKAGRRIRLCRTHFASALLSFDTTS